MEKKNLKKIEMKRVLYFLIGCIGTRLLLVYLAYILDPKYLEYLGYLCLIIGLGFIYNTFFENKLADSQLKNWKYDRVVWWKNLRPVHGILYLLFAYHAIYGISYPSILIIDVIIGFSAWFIRQVT